MGSNHLELRTNSESNKEVINEIPLSEYAKSLDNVVKKRYTEKISVIGVDPVLIPEEQLSAECFPPVEATDLVSYLVLETSFYTKEQFKNFEAYKPLTRWSLDLLPAYWVRFSRINTSLLIKFAIHSE